MFPSAFILAERKQFPFHLQNIALLFLPALNTIAFLFFHSKVAYDGSICRSREYNMPGNILFLSQPPK